MIKFETYHAVQDAAILTDADQDFIEIIDDDPAAVIPVRIISFQAFDEMADRHFILRVICENVEADFVAGFSVGLEVLIQKQFTKFIQSLLDIHLIIPYIRM